MSWNVASKDGVVTVEMNSGVPNLHNPAFFAEFNRVMDAIDSGSPGAPLILTAQGKIFSAGIDFAYQGPLNQTRDVATIADRATGAAQRFADAGLEYRFVYGLAELGLA